MTDTNDNLILRDEKAVELASMAIRTQDEAQALVVRSPHEFEQVSEFRRSIKAKYQEIDGYRGHLKEPHLEGGRRVDAFFRTPLLALKSAENNAKKVLLGYEAEQRLLADERSRKLEAEAQSKRDRLEAKARLEREKADAARAEAKREEEAARKAGDIATAAKLRHDADLAAQKSEVKAENDEFKASQVTAQEVHAYTPPVVGQHTRMKWKGRVVNAKQIPEEFKTINQKAIDAFAQATKGEGRIPGVEIYSERTMVGGG